MAFKFDDSYLGAAMAFGKKAKDAKAAGNEEEAQAMMANKASSMVGGALTAVNGVTGMLNTALQSAGIQDTSQYTNQINTLEQAGNHNYYDYGQLARDMSNTDFSVNTDYDAIRGMGGKGVTKEKIGAVGSSTLNGAMTGFQVGGPWGALAGAVIGAGSSIGGILAGDAKARVQQEYLDANADRATNLAILNFNAGLEDISDRRNRFNLVNYAAKGGKIEIKKENEGKFTAAAKRHNMTVQEFAKHVLAKKNAGKYSATMRKRANFARNAAGWKHAEGGPIDYSGIATTNNRPYNTEYISYIDSALRNGGLNDYQRAAVLANIIEESGGNPFAEGPGGFYGLLQWSGTRYPKTQEKDVYKEIDNQVANILSTATNKTDRMSWTHGGKGSGYNSLSEAMDAYNGDNLDSVMRGYTLGYVRPAGGVDSLANRLKVAQQLYNLKGFRSKAEGGDLNTSDRNLDIKSGEHNTYGFGDYLNRKAKNVVRLLIDPEARRAEHYNNTYTFEEAYKDARSKGQKTFFWNGNYYNTDYEGAHGRQYKEDIASGKASAWREAYPGYLNPELRKEKEEELATYGITNEQTQNKTTLSERALKNLGFYGDYDFKQGFDALVLNNKQRTEPDNSPRNATHYQQLRYYLGYPLQHEEITTTKAIGAPVHISKYTPTLGNNNTEYYYTFARNPYGNEGLTNNTYRQKYERLKAQTDDYLKHGFYDDAVAFGLDYAEKKANDSTKKWSDYFDKHAAELRDFSRLKNYIPATYQGRFETKDYGNVTGVGNFTQYGTPEYRSFYDLWDIGLGQGNNTKTFGLGKTYEFYDRRYHNKDKQNVPDPDIDSLYENFQYAKGGPIDYSEGGELNTSNMNTYNTHGGYFNPGLISIDAGGTHEQNPNGGVQMGVDSQGIPNLVEEGETIYDDYVFSDRLKPTASELKEFNLPEKYVGKTFSEIADKLSEEAKTRPNDAISNNGLGVMLDRLIACQEAYKQAQEERKLKRELNKLSPEELLALGAQLQQMSDQQAMAQQGMQQYMPQMEAPMMQQMPVDDQSQMMVPEQQPMMAKGGLLHVYKDGGVKETAKKVYNKAKDIDKKLHIGMLSTPTVTLPDGTEVGVNTGGGVAELLVPPVGGAGALKQLRQLTKESKKTGKLIKEGLAFLKEQEESQKKATEIMKVLGDAEDAARVSGVKYESASQAAIKAKEKVNSLIKAGDYRQAAVEHEKYTKALEKLGTATEADLSAQSALLKAQSNADKVRSIKSIEPVADATGQLSLFDNAATYTMREPTRIAGKHPWGLTAGILGGIGAAGAGAVGTSLMRNNDSEVPAAISLPVGSGVLYENADEDYAVGGHLYPWGSWLLPRRRTNYGGTSDIWPNTRITNPSVDVGQTGYGVVYAPTSGDRVIRDAYLPNAAVGNYSGYAIPAPSVSSEIMPIGSNQVQSPNVDVIMSDYQVPITLGPTYDYGAGLIQENPYRIGYSNYHVYRTNNTGQASTPVTVPETGTAAPKTTPVAGRSKTPVSVTTASTSTPAGRPSLGLPSVEPITSEAMDTSARLRRKGFGLSDVDSTALEERMPGNLTYGIQSGEIPDTVSLEGTRPHSVTRQDFGTLLPTMGRYAGAAGNALSALGIALQEPDKVRWNRIQPNYVAGNLDLQKMRYTPIDWQIGANQVNANAAATRRAVSNAGMGPAVGATLLAANYGNNQNLGNVINQTQLANDQRRAQTIGVNNQAENLMRNFDFRRNAMNTGIANQFAQYNNQLDMDETLRNIQFENDKYAALSHAISNSLADISNIGRENFVMNQINSNAALYYGVGANGWAYYKGYDGMDWKIDPNTGRKTPVVDKSEIPAQQQKCGGKLKK